MYINHTKCLGIVGRERVDTMRSEWKSPIPFFRSLKRKLREAGTSVACCLCDTSLGYSQSWLSELEVGRMSLRLAHQPQLFLVAENCTGN